MNVSLDWFSGSRYGDVETYVSSEDVYLPRRLSERYPQSITSREHACKEWYRPVAVRVIELLSLSEDWDSYGASVPTWVGARALLDVLNAVMGAKTPVPFIAPSPDGHFQAEWHLNGIDLEVEVFGPTHIDVSYVGPNARWREALTNDLGPLVQAIDTIDTADVP